MNHNFLKHGFTLIELLVAIAIVAIITSIGVANLLTAQKQARDAARKEIIGNVQSAFEQYYAEFNTYPSLNIDAAFEGGVRPVDPKDTGTYILTWDVTADAYCVCATLESGTGNASAPSGSSCNWSSTGDYYCGQNKQ
jgi:prepilin-type N-terminal cleavage/methylation domain-containing protein